MKNSLINQSFERAKRENRPALLTYTVACLLYTSDAADE